MNMIAAIARPLPAAEDSPLMPPRSPSPAVSRQILNGAERAALLASFADGRASLAAATFRRRLLRALFGFRPPIGLADARLEALRRYALLYRLEGAALPLEEDRRLREAGFADRQAEAARALVDARARRPEARAGAGAKGIMAALVAIGAAASFLTDRWLAHQVDDPLAAHVVTIMLVTWLVSITAVTGHPHSRHA